MGILAWIILGALAGWIASKIAGTDAEQGWLANIIIGILGALVGGFLFNLLGGSGVTGFNIWSLIVAVIGALVLLTVLKAMRGGKPKN
jgi:uncharacterized membrane protein YeaQ/YmgE (transglycosylase-associated protein family)